MAEAADFQGTSPSPARRWLRRTGALLRRRAVLRRTAGGARIGVRRRKTDFGSRQLLTVVGHRPGWVGVRPG